MRDVVFAFSHIHSLTHSHSHTHSHTNQRADGLKALDAFKGLAVGPGVIADVVFNSAGRFVVRDQGLITIGLKIITKILDFNLFAELTARFAHTTPDFAMFLEKGQKKN
jgi:hypothetical protein